MSNIKSLINQVIEGKDPRDVINEGPLARVGNVFTSVIDKFDRMREPETRQNTYSILHGFVVGQEYVLEGSKGYKFLKPGDRFVVGSSSRGEGREKITIKILSRGRYYGDVFTINLKKSNLWVVEPGIAERV